jgi:outer membrane lipoprotein-sorting protein
MRFEYTPPEETLVVVHANAVVIYDKRSNQGGETYPLNRTPLPIILADQVNLGRARMVTAHSFDGTATSITAQDPDRPDIGSIELKFTGDPVELRQWIVTDADGSKTTVILGESRSGHNLSNRLFRNDQASDR